MATTTLAFDLIGRDRSAGRTFDKVGKSADRLGDKFRRVGKAASRLAAGAGAALAVGLIVAAKAAAGEEQEMAVLANTLKKSTKATDEQVDSAESWITSMQNATGVADGDLRPALGKLAIATGDISDAQKLLSQALDISTARGKPLNTVVEALSKAAQGTTGGLSRLGIQVKDTSGKALAFDDILKNANETMGGAAAAAADTAAGRFKILQARFQDLVEEIGAKLLPKLNDLLAFILDDVGPALTKFKGWIDDNVLPPLRRFWHWVEEKLIPALQSMARDVLPELQDNLDTFKTSLNDVIGSFRNLGKASGNSEGTVSSLGDAFKVAGDLIVNSLVLPLQQLSFLLDVLTKIREAIDSVINGLKKIPNIKFGLGGTLGGALGDLGDLVGIGGGGGTKTPRRSSGGGDPTGGLLTSPLGPVPGSSDSRPRSEHAERYLRGIHDAVTRNHRANPLANGWAAT